MDTLRQAELSGVVQSKGRRLIERVQKLAEAINAGQDPREALALFDSMTVSILLDARMYLREWEAAKMDRAKGAYYDKLRSMPEYGEGVQAFHAGEPCEADDIEGMAHLAFMLGYGEAGKP